MRIYAFVNDGPTAMWDFTGGDQLDYAGDFEVDEDEVFAALEALWAVGNRMTADLNGKTWSPDVRSMCTGDVAIVIGVDGLEPYRVASVGWVKLTPPDAVASMLTFGKPHDCRAVRRPAPVGGIEQYQAEDR